MTLSFKHEFFAKFLGRLIVILTEELNLTVRSGGSMTFRLRKKKKGIEPDDCFWIANASAIHGKMEIDLEVDPPPDLALEVDITRSSLNRMRIYSNLRVPEVWRFSEDGLEFHLLDQEGNYALKQESASFPLAIKPSDISAFLHLRDQLDDNEVARRFREWIRVHVKGAIRE